MTKINERAMEYSSGYREIDTEQGEEFYLFLAQAHRYCIAKIGLSIFDLPDWDWSSAFEDECDPVECVNDLLEEEGYGELIND